MSTATLEKPVLNRAVCIDILVLRGGGGHYATYRAIRARLQQVHPDWQVRVIYADQLGESAGGAGQLSDALGGGSDKFYDFILKHGLSWVHLVTLHVHKGLTRLKHDMDVKLLADRWRRQPPELVLSVVPFHNRALWASLQQTYPNTPVVTVLTDFADSPPAYWFEPTTDNYAVCGTDKAVEQARRLGVRSDRVLATSGLLVHPHFYQPRPADIAAEREALGLAGDRPTGLVLFGANGSQAMLDIAKRLEPFGDRLQLILLCGRNEGLADELRAYSGAQKRAIVPFTETMPYYMHLADFFIGKPGNVSVSEALVMNLPLIVERNWLTLPQERYAADWIETKQVGLTVSSFKDIHPAIATLLEPETFARFRANAAAIENRAIFELPQMLDGILAARPSLQEVRS